MMRALHTALRRAILAARIRWVDARIRWATKDADRLAAELRQGPRQLAHWRGYVADQQIRLQQLIAQARQL